MLTIENIEVTYHHTVQALRGLSLEVPDGKIVTLLGTNGAGKTTTLKAASNLLALENGVYFKKLSEKFFERNNSKRDKQVNTLVKIRPLVLWINEMESNAIDTAMWKNAIDGELVEHRIGAVRTIVCENHDAVEADQAVIGDPVQQEGGFVLHHGDDCAPAHGSNLRAVTEEAAFSLQPICRFGRKSVQCIEQGPVGRFGLG